MDSLFCTYGVSSQGFTCRRLSMSSKAGLELTTWLWPSTDVGSRPATVPATRPLTGARTWWPSASPGFTGSVTFLCLRFLSCFLCTTTGSSCATEGKYIRRNIELRLCRCFNTRLFLSLSLRRKGLAILASYFIHGRGHGRFKSWGGRLQVSGLGSHVAGKFMLFKKLLTSQSRADSNMGINSTTFK